MHSGLETKVAALKVTKVTEIVRLQMSQGENLEENGDMTQLWACR